MRNQRKIPSKRTSLKEIGIPGPHQGLFAAEGKKRRQKNFLPPQGGGERNQPFSERQVPVFRT
jgi:hypothetical protein